MSNEEVTKREEAIYLLGFLGYQFSDLKNAQKLLENNELKNIVDFCHELDNYNRDNVELSATRISLAGLFPTLKLKGGDWYKINELMNKCNVEI